MCIKLSRTIQASSLWKLRILCCLQEQEPLSVMNKEEMDAAADSVVSDLIKSGDQYLLSACRSHEHIWYELTSLYLSGAAFHSSA